MSDAELLGYAISFAKLKNGDKTWDWDRMNFIDSPQ